MDFVVEGQHSIRNCIKRLQHWEVEHYRCQGLS